MLKNIAVVCTGNICRSPIAEGLLRERAAGQDLKIVSAGTYALSGQPADINSIEVMSARGYDIRAHRAQQATPSLLQWADLILTLDQTHSDWITGRLPHLRGRVFKLGKWRGNADIADPYRLPRAAFEKAYDEILIGVDDWLAKLKQMG